MSQKNKKNILKKLVAISIKYFECKDCNNLPPLLRPLCEVLVQLEPFILVQGILQNNKLCLKKRLKVFLMYVPLFFKHSFP